MDIRRMKEAEVHEVSALLCECYAWLGEREGLSRHQTQFLQSERGSEDSLLRESMTEMYLVAHEGTTPVGLVAVANNVIRKLYVLPSKHGAGIGRALYEAAESQIRSAGHAAVTLGAFPTAVPFYQAMGLRAVGVREPGGVLAGLRITHMEKGLEGGASENR